MENGDQATLLGHIGMSAFQVRGRLILTGGWRKVLDGEGTRARKVGRILAGRKVKEGCARWKEGR